MNAQTELETMIPQPVEIEVAGKTIALKPVTMRQLQPAIKAALPILQAIKSGALDMEKLKAMDMMAWIEAYAEHGEALTEMVAYLSGVSVEELNDWTPDEVILAAGAVVRVNTYFFVSLARQIPGAPVKEAPPTGPNPSSD
ncbi:MAG: hypothetical protein WC073_10835 [Sterolibacterium sp.]